MKVPTPPPEPGAVTSLLLRLTKGEREAEAELYALVETQLRGLAGSKLQRQRPDHTLQLTALVHEAWLRLTAPGVGDVDGRDHFLAVAARAMRSVLVDHARERNAVKRGGERVQIPLDEAVVLYENRVCDMVELDSALERLAERRPRQARIVELRFFGGLSVEETARVIGVGRATVMRDWHLARIQLRDDLGRL